MTVFNFYRCHAQPLCLWGGGEGSSLVHCVPLAATLLTSRALLLTLHCYLYSSHVCPPTKAISSLKGFLCPQDPAQCLTQQTQHIFYIIPYLLFIARMLNLYKQNKEDRAFWDYGEHKHIHINYNYIYIYVQHLPFPLRCLART